MRSFLLCALALTGACDPARIARFEIVPLAGAKADSVLAVEALQIAQTLARRYQMQPVRAYDDCPNGGYFLQDSIDGRSLGLNFCVRPSRMGMEFRVVEVITSRWGPKGDALRLALGDTLRIHFGDTAVHTN